MIFSIRTAVTVTTLSVFSPHMNFNWKKQLSFNSVSIISNVNSLRLHCSNVAFTLKKAYNTYYNTSSNTWLKYKQSFQVKVGKKKDFLGVMHK